MTNQKNKYMRSAIFEAKKSTESLKCGVVIVKNGVVIAKTYNSQKKTNNASAHAEINAIRIAGQTVGSKNLNNSEIYCTCEPCIMCLSAIVFAKIKKLYFGVSLNEVSPANKRIDISIDSFLKRSPREIRISRNFLEKECRVLY